MYEVTVSAPRETRYLLDYVINSVSPSVFRVDGVECRNDSELRSYYTLACDDAYRFLMMRNLCDSVADAIALGYKNVYVRRLLNVSGNNFFRNVLINTICVFDSAIDKRHVANLISVDSPIYLDGYYNFKLGKLKRKWQDITRLVGDNRYILNDSRLILEFLQYLLESAEPKKEKMSVAFDNDGFRVYDEDNALSAKSISLARGASDEEEAMLNLICNKPSTLRIYYREPLSPSFVDMCSALFSAEYVKVK